VKNIAIAFGVLLAALAAFAGYNVWRAYEKPLTSTPGPLETSRAQLHSQLVQTRQYEGQLEKQAWNSSAQITKLIAWHQHRIEQLNGNSQAGEIVVYDRDSVTRLQNRITELAEQEKARELAAEEKAKEEAAEQKAESQNPN